MNAKRVLHEELCLSGEDRGYWYLLTALSVIERDETVLTSVTKELYPAIALRHGVTSENVESTMRRTVRLLREHDSRAAMERILGHTLPEPPTLRHFLGQLHYYCSLEGSPSGEGSLDALSAAR